ncbi:MULTISPECIES: peptidoglycan-binding domain-containing protein [unclassified Tolypothrix]|uniref:peptidoglycan-binding domain-containing protein n=1 Tax=unclassified Tolypothrix TaxID=2649714 RepID=UPI001D138C1C|nr:MULTISPECIES: peptidoglycan-binding protein [unclassified Tolypothrix]
MAFGVSITNYQLPIPNPQSSIPNTQYQTLDFMEVIGDLHSAAVYEASATLEIVPVPANLRFWNWTKLSSTLAMRFLSVALTLSLLSIAGQTLAVQKVGSNGAEVTNIQQCLQKLGFFRGPVSGKFGSITQQAVIAFQQANKLPADGVVGDSTARSLQQACRGRIATNTSNTTSGNLRLGSRGPEVVKLQQRLQRQGYFQGPITGYFGPQTQQALTRSQQGSRNSTKISQAPSNIPSTGGEYPILLEGSQGPAVTRLQQRLQQLGYFKATPTGKFGPVTKDAVIAFQRYAGLPADGITNRQTWNRLLAPTSSPSNPVIPNTTSLAPQQIRELQEGLRQLGYLQANPTGNFGPLTRDALLRFQRDYQLAIDGVADTQALQAVRGVLQNRQAYQAPQASQAPPQTRNYLTVGDSGDNVKAVQQRLLQLGFFNTNPDGYYGENTRSYVYAFQQYSGIAPTGNVDAQTWQALGLNTSPVNTNANNNQNRYVVVVPIHNADTLNKVRQYIANPVVEKSGLGDYVNAGRFGNRTEAENLSKLLRSYGLDARVEYF